VTIDLHTQGFLDALARIDARKERKEMPTYDYKCKTCDLKMSVIRKIDEAERTPLCINCAKDLVRVYDSPSVTFMGIGWGKDA
jgi:putative FmdB family regulatory protein